MWDLLKNSGCAKNKASRVNVQWGNARSAASTKEKYFLLWSNDHKLIFLYLAGSSSKNIPEYTWKMTESIGQGEVVQANRFLNNMCWEKSGLSNQKGHWSFGRILSHLVSLANVMWLRSQQYVLRGMGTAQIRRINRSKVTKFSCLGERAYTLSKAHEPTTSRRQRKTRAWARQTRRWSRPPPMNRAAQSLWRWEEGEKDK